MNPQSTIDTATVRRRARRMDVESLEWSANDASEAAEMAERLEREGMRVQKTGGYYRDEATEYRAELARRIGKPDPLRDLRRWADRVRELTLALRCADAALNQRATFAADVDLARAAIREALKGGR